MHRFFVPPEWISDDKVTLVDDLAHQIRNVLRMKPGRKITVLDNTGYEYHIDLVHITRNVVVGEVFEKRPVENEPALRLTLFQGTLKAQKFEWVLQKGTELGISDFVPLISERSVLADVEVVDEKAIRWRRIIREAAEQSQRGLLPTLHPTRMFPQACQQASQGNGLKLLAWEDPAADNLRKVLSEAEAEAKADTESGEQTPITSLKLFIGSEGGFSLDEARLAHRYDIHPVWLGKRILRAETAGLVAASAIFYHFGDFE